MSGYLYVADKGGGADFTGDDEELLVALATAAAAGVDGPIRPDEAAITPGISTEVPALAEAGAVLRALAQTVMQLVDGEAAVVVQLVRSGSLRLVAAAGQRWTPLADQALSIDGTLSGLRHQSPSRRGGARHRNRTCRTAGPFTARSTGSGRAAVQRRPAVRRADGFPTPTG